MLISMCSCAPGYYRVDLLRICRVIALALVQICNFQIVSHVTQKIFDLVMKLYRNVAQHVKLCTWDFFCNVRVIALDLVKICNFQLVSHVAQKSIWPRVIKLYSNAAQNVKVCTCGFVCGFILFCNSYCPCLLNICNFQLVYA
jgi:hypothetical protein